MARKCGNPACPTKTFEGTGLYIYPVPDGVLTERPLTNVGLLMCPDCGKRARQLQLAEGLVKAGR